MKNLNSVFMPGFTARVLVSLFIFALPTLAQATAASTASRLLADYTPFPNARPVPWRACTKPALSVRGTSAQTTIRCPGATIDWRSNNHTVSITVPSGGKTNLVSFTDVGLKGLYAPKAFTADINGDGRADYLIENHIGPDRYVKSESGTAVLALSGPAGYKLESFVTMLLSPDAVVRQGKAVYLLSGSFANAQNMKNENHAYFLFGIREIRGQRLIQRKTVNIQYSRRPNHVPVTLQKDIQ